MPWKPHMPVGVLLSRLPEISVWCVLFTSKWWRCSYWSSSLTLFYRKVQQRFPLGRKKATIIICKREKRWRLLASQRGVILLAPLLLFLSSYLISILLWLGGFVREEIEEPAVMAIFSFLQASSPREILKGFHATLTSPLISSTYLSQAITEREGEKWTQSMMNVSWLHVRLALKCKAAVCNGRCVPCKVQNSYWCHIMLMYEHKVKK